MQIEIDSNSVIRRNALLEHRASAVIEIPEFARLCVSVSMTLLYYTFQITIEVFSDQIDVTS